MPYLRLIISLFIGILCSFNSFAQETIDPNASSELGTGVKRAYIGQYHFVDETGDSVLMVVIRDLNCFPKLKFKNKKEEEFYWRTVRDVRKGSALCSSHLRNTA